MRKAKVDLRFEKPAGPGSGSRLDAAMRRVARLVSVAALSLMILGLADNVLRCGAADLLGFKVLPLGRFWEGGAGPINLYGMSLGLVLLGLIPVVRVLVAGWMYVRAQRRLDALVALAVLLELAASMYIG